MDLSLIFTIPGKPGLFKLVSQGKNSAVVEALADGKRMPMFNLNQVSSLAEIAIYTYQKEVALTDVFRAIYKKENGGQALSHKADAADLKKWFEEVLPEYDRERVYDSNIRKVAQWYNILQEKGLVDLELSEREKAEAGEMAEQPAEAPVEQPAKAPAKPKEPKEAKEPKASKAAKAEKAEKPAAKAAEKAAKPAAAKKTAAKPAAKKTDK
ncbi:MAG: DUF5606 domain-containing protein [Bacteroidales bacterium]|nr:DUF5606 domain-containing protein [Bacteroidales bacterium]